VTTWLDLVFESLSGLRDRLVRACRPGQIEVAFESRPETIAGLGKAKSTIIEMEAFVRACIEGSNNAGDEGLFAFDRDSLGGLGDASDHSRSSGCPFVDRMAKRDLLPLIVRGLRSQRGLSRLAGESRSRRHGQRRRQEREEDVSKGRSALLLTLVSECGKRGGAERRSTQRPCRKCTGESESILIVEKKKFERSSVGREKKFQAIFGF